MTLSEMWAAEALAKTTAGKAARQGRWTKEFLKRAEKFAREHFETTGKYPKHDAFKIPTAARLYAARAQQD